MNTADKLLASQFGYESKALREVVLHHPILVGTAVSGWAMAYPDQIEGMDSKQFFIHSKITALNPGKRALETPEWYLVALADTDQVESALSLAFWTSVNIGIILLCLALAAGTLLSRRIVEPLRLLREDVREIAGGNLNAEVTIKTQDELQELARDVNAMAGRLRESYQDLERSVEEAESRAAQLAAINQITGAMTAALTLSETAESLGKYLEKLAPIQYASIALPQPDIDDFDMWVIHSTADSDDVFKTSEIRLAFERERTTIVNSERLSERTGGTLLRGVVLPLSANQELIGTLNLASDTPEALNSEQLGNLTFLAEALAAAIQHHRLYEQVSEFAAALEEKVKERTEELQAAQVKLLQTEKFAATGRLAANLAHEINNPLGIIKNHLFLLDSQLDRLAMNLTFSLQNEQPIDETKILESKKTTTVCREEIERIARLTRGLLNFYRTPSGTSMEIDLPLVLDDILLLVSKEFERKNISIKVIKRSKIPRTFLSPDLVRQVFMNLLRNAEDAIEKDGKVSVIFDTDNYPPSPNAENPMVKKSIVITIKDSGKGIAPEHLDKIFDPFFTTKMEGKGTGLGLSVTLGIVERLQGAITVESKPEEYTAFTLRLPVQQGKAKKINAEDGNGATNADRDMDQSVVSTTHHK
jgi:signal transduction histidine kinase